MKRIGILIGWLVWAAGVSAQSWSLDDCMKYAVEHATEVKREVVNARQRKQDYQHAVAGFLPTVTGGVQGQYAWGRNIDPETNFFFCPFCLQGKKCLTDLFIQTIFCFFHWYILKSFG